MRIVARKVPGLSQYSTSVGVTRSTRMAGSSALFHQARGCREQLLIFARSFVTVVSLGPKKTPR
jgi:hypothetical protein